MTPEQARELVEDAIGQVAPNADLTALSPQADLRDELELDSLDFLTFVEGLGARTGRRIEEDDYPELATLGRCIGYLTGTPKQVP
jgi:acyl carrier protein